MFAVRNREIDCVLGWKFDAALAEFEADAGLRAAVLTCDGRTFIAGAPYQISA
jgi:hypothetical protein